ncbi:MAG: hypothetical protein Tsb0021_03830 [Chlamydiales bacterium]
MNLTKTGWLALLLALVILSVIVIDRYRDLSVAIPADLKPELPSQPYEGWREYESRIGGFSAKFPGLPQNAKNTITERRSNQVLVYDMYIAEQWDGTVYMVTVVTYPFEIQQKEEVLSNFLSDVLTSNPQNELVLAVKEQFRGQEALKFKVKTNQAYIDALAFIRKDKLYYLSEISANLEEEGKDFQYFIDSFQLLENKS